MADRGVEVRAAWDDAAGVWYVRESDAPGLVAEGETLEALRETLIERVPELLDLNRHLIDWRPDGDISLHLLAKRDDTVRIPA
jgi:hypothetical protein